LAIAPNVAAPAMAPVIAPMTMNITMAQMTVTTV
jgi:hypothetical protein